MTSDKTTNELTETTVADFAAAKANQDKKRYRLEYPITAANGEMIEELWMRRPLLKDKQVAEWQAPDNDQTEVTMRMLAAITDQPLEVIEELDSEFDMLEMIQLLNKSFKAQPQIDGNVLSLRYPMVINGKMVDRLTLQRPKAKDALSYKDEKVSETMARLVGYRMEDLKDMDLLTDWLGLEQVYVSFRKRQPKRK